jgi:transcriptional regulator with XRE-family HTH domain
VALSHPVDTHVGSRLRQRRALLGMSQTDLGKAVGLTFQQVQKYERGFNRISSSRLFEFSKVLDVPVAHFFEGADVATSNSAKRKPGRPKAADKPAEADLNTKRETLELVRAYYKIRSKSLRTKTRDLIEALAKD